jgi:CheY-like chemotaxis protein
MAKTVVLIDDDQDDLDILKDVIDDIDPTIHCLCFLHPVEAIRIISHELPQKPDFIFTDINMPGMSGDRCVKELRNQDAFDQTVITVLSTSMPYHVAEQLKSLGANHTFQKPVHVDSYKSILKTILYGS